LEHGEESKVAREKGSMCDYKRFFFLCRGSMGIVALNFKTGKLVMYRQWGYSPTAAPKMLFAQFFIYQCFI